MGKKDAALLTWPVARPRRNSLPMPLICLGFQTKRTSLSDNQAFGETVPSSNGLDNCESSNRSVSPFTEVIAPLISKAIDRLRPSLDQRGVFAYAGPWPLTLSVELKIRTFPDGRSITARGPESPIRSSLSLSATLCTAKATDWLSGETSTSEYNSRFASLGNSVWFVGKRWVVK